MPKLAVCVPYRNREEHMEKFIPHMTEILTKQNIDFTIYIAHQKDSHPFNRGKLLNAAFSEAVKDGCDYFAFHDIDMLPIEGHADYSIPQDFPVLISTEIDEYNFEPPYKEYFGGCVMFTKEQFEKINGFGNDYWGWGAEDDDLFWRTKSQCLTERITTPYSLGTKKVATFNGTSSFIEIPLENDFQGVESGNYTLSLTVKVENLRKMKQYVYGDPDAYYVVTPLVTRHAFDLIAYCNTQDVKGITWSDENIPTEAWTGTMFGEWYTITVVYNAACNEIRLYLNGVEISKTATPSQIRKYYQTPFLIGKGDISKWMMHDNSYMSGAVSQFSIWDKPLSTDEISIMHSKLQYEPQREGLIAHFDFSDSEGNTITDRSKNKLTAKLHDITLTEEYIGPLLLEEGPYRRHNRYTTLKHEKQGVVNGKMVQSENSKKNTEHFYKLMTSGEKSFVETGLTTLEYSLLNRSTISENAIMLDLAI